MCCNISLRDTKEFLIKNAKNKFIWGWKQLYGSGNSYFYGYKYSAGEHRLVEPNTFTKYKRRLDRNGFHFWLKEPTNDVDFSIKVKVYWKDIIGIDYDCNEAVANAITIEKKDWQNFKRRMSRRAKCVAS